jgi:DNA-binding GntR family transcriptional regulator
MYGFVSGGLTLPLYIDRYVECHRQIFNAVKKNDATKAATLMRNHLMESKDFLVSTLHDKADQLTNVYEPKHNRIIA